MNKNCKVTAFYAGADQLVEDQLTSEEAKMKAQIYSIKYPDRNVKAWELDRVIWKS